MNLFAIVLFWASEKNRFRMRVLIIKYELKMITIKEYQFHNKDTLYYRAKNNFVILPKCTESIYNICFCTNKCNIYLILHVLWGNVTLYTYHQAETLYN
jgi:hypothetical protein